MNRKIVIGEPYLPPLEEFLPYLQAIWQNKVLTNAGPNHKLLEDKLCEYLGVSYLSLFTNGTIALVAALRTLNLSGEVITTPFSFVATAHSLLWSGLTPVFVDIDPKTLNIDPKKIEEAISPRTTAILAVHCYGRPCDVDAIKSVAEKNNLKVVYDAAHAFGTKCHCGSVLNHGDLSVLSFHATKSFNTFEGGAVISNDKNTKMLLDNVKNFGIIDETTVGSLGINGKMTEVSAAFGLLQLKYYEFAHERRKEIDTLYRKELCELDGIECSSSLSRYGSNYSYFPILIHESYPLSRNALFEKLKRNNVYSRRYFYPLISEFELYRNYPSASKSNLVNAYSISEKILCLPIHPNLDDAEVRTVAELIRSG